MDYYVEKPEVKTRNITELKGPLSPLEMEVNGKIYSLLGYHTKVEDDSVNSVMLDDQPEDRHDRVLIAAQVLELFIIKQTTNELIELVDPGTIERNEIDPHSFF